MIFWISSGERFRPSPYASFLICSSVRGIPFFQHISQISSSLSPKLFPLRKASSSSFVSFPHFQGSFKIFLISSFVKGTPFIHLPRSFAISASVNLTPYYSASYFSSASVISVPLTASMNSSLLTFPPLSFFSLASLSFAIYLVFPFPFIIASRSSFPSLIPFY